jgi:hypothetical protein
MLNVFRRNSSDVDVCFSLDQLVVLYIYSANSLKQMPLDRHVAKVFPLFSCSLLSSDTNICVIIRWTLSAFDFIVSFFNQTTASVVQLLEFSLIPCSRSWESNADNVHRIITQILVSDDNKEQLKRGNTFIGFPWYFKLIIGIWWIIRTMQRESL